MDKSSILMLIDGKVSNTHKFMLSEMLDNQENLKNLSLPLLNLKNPMIALILGLFFGAFGVDRFYQGNVGRGILKLGLFIVGVIGLFVFVGLFVLFALQIYVLVDLYFVYKDVQDDNYQKILQLLKEEK